MNQKTYKAIVTCRQKIDRWLAKQREAQVGLADEFATLGQLLAPLGPPTNGDAAHTPGDAARTNPTTSSRATAGTR